ncbi:MAG: hypothetical protein P4L46_00020 [Fimbriimonas sp.]|nr:hypothetical protein [Fimbriimonas sp.]
MDSPFTFLAKPAQRALASAGITELTHLSSFTENQIARLHGMGPSAIRRLSLAMEEAGIAFADDPEVANDSLSRS